MIIDIAKVRENVKLPTRSNPSDAGLDLYYNPKIRDLDLARVIIKPKDSVLLSTGIKVAIPHGKVLEIKNRSGMASKKSLVVGACIVDSGYEGEVFVNMHNIGEVSQIINVHDKIAQAIVYSVDLPKINVVDEDCLYDRTTTISSRKDGSLGSTG